MTYRQRRGPQSGWTARSVKRVLGQIAYDLYELRCGIDFDMVNMRKMSRSEIEYVKRVMSELDDIIERLQILEEDDPLTRI